MEVHSRCLQAYTALNNAETMGQRAMKLTYLELYPGETLLRGRLGQKVWETYAHFEADFADISAGKVGRSKARAAGATPPPLND